MEKINKMVEELHSECVENNVACLTIVGNERNFNVSYTADLDEVGENLYFALTRDPKLYEVVSEAVRIATEALAFDNEDDNDEE